MMALSILQPWAWMIAAGHKDVENRSWYASYRGPFLIHAGLRWDEELEDDLLDLEEELPELDWENVRLHRGGIIGMAEIVDCVTHSNSRWFNGPRGFVVQNARLVVPFGYRGQLGFFDVPEISGPDDPLLFDASARGKAGTASRRAM